MYIYIDLIMINVVLFIQDCYSTGTSVNAACNDLTTAATCCGDNTCSWIPTCTDQATRCTSDAATDCPDEENDTANCANGKLFIIKTKT